MVDEWDLSVGAGFIKFCIEAIYTWLSNNNLTLNPSEPEAIQFGDAKGELMTTAQNW